MFVLDSDTYTHLLHKHPRVVARMENAITQCESVGVTIITKTEALQGRMATVLKADTHERFLHAQQELLTEEKRLEAMRIVLLDESALHIFDQLGGMRD